MTYDCNNAFYWNKEKETIKTFFSKYVFFAVMDCWYFATSFYNDFAALGNQLTRYRSFIILSCFGNDRARSVTFLMNTSPLCIVDLTGNISKL